MNPDPHPAAAASLPGMDHMPPADRALLVNRDVMPQVHVGTMVVTCLSILAERALFLREAAQQAAHQDPRPPTAPAPPPRVVTYPRTAPPFPPVPVTVVPVAVPVAHRNVRATPRYRPQQTPAAALLAPRRKPPQPSL